MGKILVPCDGSASSLRAADYAAGLARQLPGVLLQANYRAGLAAWVDVLVADEQLRQTQIDYVQALAQRFQDSAALYLALGGGWWRMAGQLQADRGGR